MLPLGVHVERTAVDSIRAVGPVGLHAFVKYLEPRLAALAPPGQAATQTPQAAANPPGPPRPPLAPPPRPPLAPKARNLIEGDTFATFEPVTLAVRPAATFRLRLSAAPPRGTLLELDDVTPPPLPMLPDEESRWRNVGATPQGKIADPAHFE